MFYKCLITVMYRIISVNGVRQGCHVYCLFYEIFLVLIDKRCIVNYGHRFYTGVWRHLIKEKLNYKKGSIVKYQIVACRSLSDAILFVTKVPLENMFWQDSYESHLHWFWVNTIYLYVQRWYKTMKQHII